MDHDNSKDHVYDHEEEDVELQEVASLNEKEDLSVGVQGVRFVYNQLLCVLFLAIMTNNIWTIFTHMTFFVTRVAFW